MTVGEIITEPDFMSAA